MKSYLFFDKIKINFNNRWLKPMVIYSKKNLKVYS